MAAVLEIVFTLIFAIHLLSVNVAMAAPLVCLWLHSRAGRNQDGEADRVGQRLARCSLGLAGVGLLSGGLLLAILWLQEDQSYFDAMRQFSAWKYFFAFAELIFYFACMGAYLRFWNWGLATRRSRFIHGVLAVLASSNLLYHFPPMMAVLATIPTRAEWIGVPIDAKVFRTWMIDPEILSRVLHVWLSSFAVTGIALMAMSQRASQEDGEAETSRLAVVGARIALVPTLLQLLVGVWVLLTVPNAAQSALMGGDMLGTGLLAISILLALGLMHFLASAALGQVNRKTTVQSILVLLLLVLCMSGVLRRVRSVSSRVSGNGNSSWSSDEKSRTDCSARGVRFVGRGLAIASWVTLA